MTYGVWLFDFAMSSATWKLGKAWKLVVFLNNAACFSFHTVEQNSPCSYVEVMGVLSGDGVYFYLKPPLRHT